MEDKQKTEEPKTETSVKYDDRRKVMIQYFESTQEIKIGDKVVGESVMKRTATFNEEGIRNALKELNRQRTKFEQTIKQINDNLKDIPELTPEQKKLEEDLKSINDFNKSSQMKTQLKTNEADLKLVKKDIRDIKEAVGTRLKF